MSPESSEAAPNRLPSKSPNIILANTNIVCGCVRVCQKKWQIFFGTDSEQIISLKPPTGSKHNNRIDIFELRQLCRIDIYTTIYSCHGNHIGVYQMSFFL